MLVPCPTGEAIRVLAKTALSDTKHMGLASQSQSPLTTEDTIQARKPHRLHPTQGLSPGVGPPRRGPTSLPGPEEQAGGRRLFSRKVVDHSRKDMGEGEKNHIPPTWLCKHY